MTNDREHELSDEDIQNLLTNALSSLPDVATFEDPPPSVVSGAMWIHDWHNMEAELAELTFDSDLNREGAGVRASGSLRELTFESDGHVIELEIERRGRSNGVNGTVAPPVTGEVVLLSGGEPFVGTIDESGSFSIAEVPHGTALAFVEGPGGRVRLGSFEV